MGLHNLVNTQYFREAAIDFKRNGKMYTRAPEGSREYIDYWEMQEDRCLNGYTVGGITITGRHYFYMNFCPINRAINAMGDPSMKDARIIQKDVDLPDFYETSYEWYRFKHIAWYGGTFMGVKSPGGLHISCAKARGAGWSYMEAADACYNYTFFNGAKSYFFAGIEKYLTEDGVMNKVGVMLDHINEHCSWWRKLRLKKNTPLHYKASYLDDRGVEKGSMSEIIGIAVDDPNKVRGKRGMKITFEEGGSFRNLKKAFITSLGSMKDGSYLYGQMTVLGTGGEEGPGIEGLEEIFYEPEQYGMLAFPNIYDEGMEHTKCGYFVPVFRTDRRYMDQDGNVDTHGAIQEQLKERELKGKARDKKTLDNYIAEYPFNPREAFKRLANNPFWTERIDRQITRIENDASLQGNIIRHGKLIEDPEKGVMFVESTDVAPILNYPHTHEDNLEGCATMYEAPHRLSDGTVPDDMYELVFDPFYNDEADDQTSLFHFWVWKTVNPYTTAWEDLPVFEWAGRPNDLNTAYENLFRATKLYNCKAQGEIAGGGKGVLDYARTNQLLHKIHFEPEIVAKQDKEIDPSGRNRKYLMNMPTETKKMGLTYLVQWHKRIRGLNQQGQEIYTIDNVYSLPFLREMRKFDGKKNADRISSAIISRFMVKEKVHKQAAAEQDRGKMDDFYARQFGNATSLDMDFVPFVQPSSNKDKITYYG